jgi:hypothetical protein
MVRLAPAVPSSWEARRGGLSASPLPFRDLHIVLPPPLIIDPPSNSSAVALWASVRTA